MIQPATAQRQRRWIAALSAQQAGALEAAAAWFEAIMADEDPPADVRGRLATVYLDDGRFDDAIAFCQRWTTDAPDDAEAWFLLGAAYGHAGDHAAAVEATRSGLVFAPEEVRGWANLGWGLAQLGDLAGCWVALTGAASRRCRSTTCGLGASAQPAARDSAPSSPTPAITDSSVFSSSATASSSLIPR